MSWFQHTEVIVNNTDLLKDSMLPIYGIVLTEEKWPLAIDPNLESTDEPPFTPVIEVPLPPYELQTSHRVLSYKDFTADKTTATLHGRVAALGLDSHDQGGTKIQTTRPSQLKPHCPRREGLRKSDNTKSDIILSSSKRTYGSLKRMSRHKCTGGKEQPTWKWYLGTCG